jgi:hypothetical protein
LNGKYKVYKLTDDDSIVIKDSDIKIYKFWKYTNRNIKISRLGKED